MRSNDKKQLKKMLDKIKVQEASNHFEQRIYQDWQRVVANANQPTFRLSEVLALARLHPRLIGLIAIAVITASVFLGQHLLTSQDEQLHQIDALSELSLSTL